MSDLVVAETIRSQIGRRALIEVGAKNFVGDERSLRFNTHNCAGVKVIVTLNADDAYDVVVGVIRKYEWVEVLKFDGVYADQLSDVMFEIARRKRS